MNRFILAIALAAFGTAASAQAQGYYYYYPNTGNYYHYSPGIVQAGSIVVSPATSYVTPGVYYNNGYTNYAPTFYYPRDGYSYRSNYYSPPYNYGGWQTYGRGFYRGWRR